MARRKSNLGRRTRESERLRRLFVNRTEEQRASANERHRQRMAQIRAKETPEQRAARLEDARLKSRLQAQRLRSAASALLRSQQKERDRLREAERRQQETPDHRQTRLPAQQSRDYYRLAFQYNPADDCTVTEVCPYCKAQKLNGETKIVLRQQKKLNCLNLEKRQCH